MADGAGPQDLPEEKFIESTGHFGAVEFDRPDPPFDVLLLIGQEFVKLSVPLHIGLLLQKAECLRDSVSVLLGVEIEPIPHEDRDVRDSRLEELHIFD